MLQSIGYTREEVYVSNVVKYRPPSNREPQEEEKDACRVWLNAELLFVKPKVIVTLGRHSLGRFVPGASITASHGQSFEHQTGIPIFAMYHPAAALYNPNLKEDMRKDFKALKKFLSTLPKKTADILKKKEAIDEILKM